MDVLDIDPEKDLIEKITVTITLEAYSEVVIVKALVHDHKLYNITEMFELKKKVEEDD